MNVDISIVKNYLDGNCQYKNHWLFRSIDESGAYFFDCPSEDKKAAVQVALENVLELLDDFYPLNLDLFQRLFPKWRELCDSVNVIIAVGCPAPYDAMVREHDSKEYIIIDLIRLLDYGMDMRALITQFFTHELAHVCIHADYPEISTAEDYRKKLECIVFDEGFAHLLAFKDKLDSVDFSPFIQKHYNKSFCKLKLASSESDAKKQMEYLTESNAGAYWNKFGAICGKLYLAMHLDEVEAIYKNGSEKMYEGIFALGEV